MRLSKIKLHKLYFCVPTLCSHYFFKGRFHFLPFYFYHGFSFPFTIHFYIFFVFYFVLKEISTEVRKKSFNLFLDCSLNLFLSLSQSLSIYLLIFLFPLSVLSCIYPSAHFTPPLLVLLIVRFSPLPFPFLSPTFVLFNFFFL